jgi:hypothetical protein
LPRSQRTVLHCVPVRSAPEVSPSPPTQENALAKPPNFKQEKKRREEAQKKKNEAKQQQKSARKGNASDPADKVS